MRHHNSVLHGLLKHVPWSVFDKLVQAHGADARVRPVHRADSLGRRLTVGFGVGHLGDEVARPPRAELEQQYEEVNARFDGRDIPLPEFWGGYRVVPERFEFWQGCANRLHDRFEYRLAADGWRNRRLSP